MWINSWCPSYNAIHITLNIMDISTTSVYEYPKLIILHFNTLAVFFISSKEPWVSIQCKWLNLRTNTEAQRFYLNIHRELWSLSMCRKINWHWLKNNWRKKKKKQTEKLLANEQSTSTGQEDTYEYQEKWLKKKQKIKHAPH